MESENKKTIVIFSCFYEPFMSGAERFVKEVVERLSNRYRFIVITAKLCSDLPDREDTGEYKIIRIGKGNKWDKLRYIWLAPLEAKKYNPQIIHAVMESYAGLALWRAKKAVSNVKRILTLQSGDLDAKIWSKMPILWKGIHRSPDEITAISNFLADRAKRLGAKNIEVVPNGVDFTQIEPVLKIGDVKHDIVCVARLSWEKDHKNLVAAMPKILEKYSDTKLILVGDGPLREKIENQIKELKLENSVKLLGNLSHKEALCVLAKGDVSICPSLAEGLGIVFIEAQACGVPVIGTRVGGIPDVIEDGKTGILIEPSSSEQIANAIVKIFEMSSEKRKEMIELAKINARRNFSWDVSVEKIDNIYQKPKLLNILIATGIYPPEIGGPATYSKLIGEKLSQRGHKVRILTYSNQNIKDGKLVVTGVSKKLPVAIRHLAYFLQVLKLGRNSDLIYMQDSVSVGLPATLANIFLKKKLALKVVGDYAWEQAEQVPELKDKMPLLDSFYPFLNENYPLKIQILEKIQNWVARRAEKIITPSFYLKKVLINGWKINPEKIKVVYNSFDIKELGIRNKELGNKFKILSIGRLMPWKGFDTLIDIVKDIPNVDLEIIGDGPEYKNYESRIMNHELQNRIKLLGRLSHDEVIDRMQKADLFILNTAYEGLSHVILEAMACGTPIAVSRAGGNTELIGENEERGELFEYNNKEQIKEIICRTVSSTTSYTAKTKKAREFISGFNEEMMIDQLENNLQR